MQPGLSEALGRFVELTICGAREFRDAAPMIAAAAFAIAAERAPRVGAASNQVAALELLGRAAVIIAAKGGG